MPLRHLLLALAVVAVWGSNFAVIKIALASLPPLLLATLRFLFAFFPAALFLRRPAVSWRALALYGVLIGAGQFGLLYVAMDGRISPGLASLVVQIQVFFTIGLAIVLAGERVQGYQWMALLLAAAGIGVIALHADTTTTPAGLVLVLLAALAWAGGNQVTRQIGRVDMLAFVVWSSLFALPPLIVLTLVFEGAATVRHALAAATPAVWAAVLWQSLGNTMFGYAAWGWLLARHPAAEVSPLALLVPVFGMGTSALVLGEPLPGWKLGAAALVLGGLALNLFWPGLRARWRGWEPA
ncbi:MAG: EamA family transporter [Burkholderiales bacterium]|nr:EamA family transporter [Burkholderiales bacterium]